MRPHRTITVYGLTNAHGNICYVGMSSNPRARFAFHSANNHWGFQVCGLAVLATTQRQKEARDLERQWIRFLGKDNLYNVLNGGGGDVLGRLGGRRPLTGTCIMFTAAQEAYVKKKAKKFFNGNFSAVIKDMVNRKMIEMGCEIRRAY